MSKIQHLTAYEVSFTGNVVQHDYHYNTETKRCVLYNVSPSTKEALQKHFAETQARQNAPTSLHRQIAAAIASKK